MNPFNIQFVLCPPPGGEVHFKHTAHATYGGGAKTGTRWGQGTGPATANKQGRRAVAAWSCNSTISGRSRPI